MKTIKEIMKDIEKENNITILFATENGSRAWCMESADSDHDIRFVYYRPTEEYLGLNLPKDIIIAHYDRKHEKCPQQGCFLDIIGFDIYKYGRLLLKSNPTAVEWAISDIEWYGKKPEIFINYAVNKINPISLYHHYKSMGRNNYDKYIRNDTNVTHKRYLYALRGVVNALYVENFESTPWIDFPQTCKEVRYYGVLPNEIYLKIEEVIKIKKDGTKKDKIERITILDEFIEHQLDKHGDPSSLRERDPAIEQFILDTVMGENHGN